MLNQVERYNKKIWRLYEELKIFEEIDVVGEKEQVMSLTLKIQYLYFCKVWTTKQEYCFKNNLLKKSN